ncbi:hypothetical protein KJZ67_02615, partial [Patescibacteria group bacterium]|nr:hypothetical protein [Patescibacteria group bacterium]
MLAEIRAELDQEQVEFEIAQNTAAQQRRIAISQLAEEIDREEARLQSEAAARIAALQETEAELVRLRQQAIADQRVLDDINALEERIRQRKIAYEASRPQPAPIPVVNIDFVPEPEPEVETGTQLFSDAWIETLNDLRAVSASREWFTDFAADIEALMAAANAETNAALQREILARMDTVVIAALDAIGNELPLVSDEVIREMRARIAARQEAREREAELAVVADIATTTRGSQVGESIAAAVAPGLEILNTAQEGQVVITDVRSLMDDGDPLLSAVGIALYYANQPATLQQSVLEARMLELLRLRQRQQAREEAAASIEQLNSPASQQAWRTAQMP